MTRHSANSKNRRRSSRPDLATLGGLLLGVGGVLAGLLLEGGRIRDVAQITAALIVLGGTIGAVMITTPLAILSSAVRRLPQVFFDRGPDEHAAVGEILALAAKARRSGIVSLEEDADEISDPLLRKAMTLAIDGADLQQIQEMMELEISVLEQRGEAEARVFEAAGGYAPTIGIIGAVLGLIQVMKDLANIDEVGRGIAVAFVATVYGVGSANLFFLPAAGKLRARLQDLIRVRELIQEGVAGIVEGLNPKLIRLKLEAYVPSASSDTSDRSAKRHGASATTAIAEG